jgi:uncharacterized membrane protein HdeD (DUF308 family)
MKETINAIESRIGGLLKDAPALPKDSKKALVNAWPIIALVFGVLQLFAAYGLWRAMSFVERIDSALAHLYAYAGYSSTDRLLVYLAIVVLVVDAVILLMAYPELKKKTNRGWDLLFLGGLLNLLYAVVSLFVRGGGVSSFMLSLVGSVAGFYLLFQVRDVYKGTSQKVAKTAK